VTPRRALSLGLVVEVQRYQTNAWDAKRGHFGYKRSTKRGVHTQGCLGEAVIKGAARLTPCSLPGHDPAFNGSVVEETEARINHKYRNSLRSL
jgi:hypothetical protein